MRTRDLVTIAELGKALWADPGRSTPAVVDTLSAITLQDMTEDRALERACAALLERALQQGIAANTHSNLQLSGAFSQPFWRMYPSERFLLVALHLGRWSYARLARVMKTTPEQIEIMAWKARTRLATDLSRTPLGGSIHGVHCPEYDLDRPWTQRFLDEEIESGRERLFMQNHLMACKHCLQSLNRCRDLYYAVERQLPKVGESDDVVRALEAVCRTSRYIRFRTESVLLRSVIAFLQKKDVQVALVGFALIVLWSLMRYR